MWAPNSKINNWSEIPGANCNDVPLTLAGPGSQSGTYDFFNEEVLGEDAAGETVEPRQDYTASEDDNVIVRAVESAPGAMGYFGFTYYEENADQLTAFTLDGVAPDAATITSAELPAGAPALHLREGRVAQQQAPGRGVRRSTTSRTRSRSPSRRSSSRPRRSRSTRT